MPEYLFGGMNERPDGTFSITPHMPLGRIDADLLDTIANVVRRFNLPGLQANTAQRISIEGVPAESVDEIVKMLNGVGDRCPQSIIACRGQGGCKNGLQETLDMATRLEDLLLGLEQMPAHLKIGLSGCPRCCGQSYVRDCGLVGTNNGWTLVFGGNGGNKVRCGDEILVNASSEEILVSFNTVLLFYKENAKKGERTARFVERLGIDTIKSTFLNT